MTVYNYFKNRISYKLSKLNDNNNNVQLLFRLSYFMEKNLSLIEKLSKYKKQMFLNQNKEIISFLIDKNKKLIKNSKQLYKMFGIIFLKNYKTLYK